MSAIDVVYDDGVDRWIVARAAQRGAETLVEYTDDHLARDADLTPLRHPLHDRTRRFSGNDGAHLPGLLADALPDSWGRLVLRRDMRQHGIEQPTPFQMLRWLGRRTMGALTLQPSEGPAPPDITLLDLDLDRVQGEMLRHLTGEESRDALAEQLTRAAGSGAGGARPKLAVGYTAAGTLVADNGNLPPGSTPWLVKFHSVDDSDQLSAVEAAYLQMAAIAGIATCEHTLLSGSSGVQYLAVRRFDRVAVPGAPPRRIHMATAAGLLEAYPEYHQHLGYVDLIRLTRQVTGDARDVAELLRRAIFNVIAHNRDDHARNISYLWTTSDGWRLSPAYDLTHSMGPRPAYVGAGPGEHYLDVSGKGSGITRDDLTGLAKPAGLKPAAVGEMVDEVLAAVTNWPTLASANGVDGEVARQIAQRLPALAG